MTAAGIACVLFGLVGLVLLTGPAGLPITAAVAVVAAVVHLSARRDYRR